MSIKLWIQTFVPAKNTKTKQNNHPPQKNLGNPELGIKGKNYYHENTKIYKFHQKTMEEKGKRIKLSHKKKPTKSQKNNKRSKN
jgi:hypothetical protein